MGEVVEISKTESGETAGSFAAILQVLMEEEVALEETWEIFMKQVQELSGLKISSLAPAEFVGLAPPKRKAPAPLCCCMCGADLHGPFCSVCGANNG